MKRFFAVTIILAIAVLSGCANPGSSKIEVQTLAKSGQSWEGSILPNYPQTAPEITILRITIPPKTELPLHRHPVINAGILLKGQLTVTTDQHETVLLKAGDALIEVSNKWHYGRNNGNEPAEIIVFYAGTEDGQITIKK